MTPPNLANSVLDAWIAFGVAWGPKLFIRIMSWFGSSIAVIKADWASAEGVLDEPTALRNWFTTWVEG